MAKDFKSPAMDFISTTKKNNKIIIEERYESVPMKRDPTMVETKSKRVQLLMQPSLHRKIKDEAKQKGRSVNDLIHNIMEQYFNGE